MNSYYFQIFLKKIFLKPFGFVSLIFLVTNCTYDKSMIYKKHYEVKINSSLRFGGFYNGENKKIITETGNINFKYPVFFYQDGSVIFMGATKDTTQMFGDTGETIKSQTTLLKWRQLHPMEDHLSMKDV